MTMFGTDSFKKRVERAFASAGVDAQGKLSPEGVREAYISLGGRPSLPLERIRELIPKYSFENDGTVSKGAFAKLIEYLGKGHNVVDEMDAVYNKLAASRSKCSRPTRRTRRA